MYYNYIKARFYADICTNDTYSILQVSAKVNRYWRIWYRLLYLLWNDHNWRKKIWL